MKIQYVIIFFFLSVFFVEATYYQCEVSVDLVEGVDFGYSNGIAWVNHNSQRCYDYKFNTHICQIYDYNLNSDEMQKYCEDFCLKRSNTPKGCKVKVEIKESTNIEAHQEKEQVGSLFKDSNFVQKLLNLFKGKDDIDVENIDLDISNEEKEKIEAITKKIENIDLEDKTIVENVKGLFEKKCPDNHVLFEKRCVPDCDFDQKWNGKECVLDKPLKPNEYEIMYNSKDEKVIKFIDAYGQEKYTKDGKYYYDSYGQASVNNPLRNAYHSVTEGFGGIKDFFFKTKLKDSDEELKREISREVIKDFRKDAKKEKTIGKIEEKVGKLAENVLPKHIKDLVSVPADSIKDFAKEAKETEFAEGASIYMKYRSEGKSQAQMYEDSPEELIYGGIGGGVAQGLNSEYPKALLFSKYEESYQRYKLAKELGRKE